MSLFLPNIPMAGDLLDFSQNQLLSNNSGLDTVFGIDHYKFSDSTANKGFHNTVTQPIYTANAGNPPITITNPIIYAIQQTGNVGTLQYSKGPTPNPANPTIPTPLTSLHSHKITGFLTTTSINILDFTGVTQSFFEFWVYDSTQLIGGLPVNSVFTGFWNGTLFATGKTSGTSGLVFLLSSSGNILTLTNNTVFTLNNLYWTLNFKRLQ